MRQPNNPYRNNTASTTYTTSTETTLFDLLNRHMNGKSRTALKQLLAKGAVRLGNQTLKKLDHPLPAGATITINHKPTPQYTLPPSLRIVYEDDHLLVVHKDAGLLTIATTTEREHTAYAYLSAYLKFYNPNDKIFIVHRIDRATSGLLIFAKSVQIQHAMRDNWDQTVSSRRYVAVVQGIPKRQQGTISTWIDEDPQTTKMYVSSPGQGKHATTHYHVLKTNNNLALVELELETGRKNQIRVHMKHIGHTLVGDKKYGSTLDPISRLCLHAMQIEFEHPVTRKTLNFETPIPSAFLSLF